MGMFALPLSVPFALLSLVVLDEDRFWQFVKQKP